MKLEIIIWFLVRKVIEYKREIATRFCNIRRNNVMKIIGLYTHYKC
jgi:hypothetical protein